MAMVGTAVLGFVVTKLLDQVLIAMKRLKNRRGNLLKLQKILERLQPSVIELSSFVQDDNHPAGRWLTDLREQLEKSLELVNASGRVGGLVNVSGRIVKLFRTSKECLKVYDKIQGLLREASTLQWASGMAIQRILVENDAKMLEESRAAQEREQQLFQRIADLPSKGEILHAISELELEQVRSSENSDGSSSSAVPTESLRTDSTCDATIPEVTFGGEVAEKELIAHLLHRDCKKWVGLYGMGGIGKTVTAGRVYSDPRIQRHFSGGRFWLTVSKDQRGPNHLHKVLQRKIEGRTFVSQMDPEAAKSYLKSLLDRDRVLVVLDDVWQNDVLGYLDVVSEQKHGVILVTTRDKGVLRKVIDFLQIFEVRPLSKTDSWKLFSWHAFGVRGRAVPRDVEAVANDVAEECQGLPLALEVIGSTMADKELFPEEKALGMRSVRVWEIALEHLRNANYGKNEYDALYLKLQLSVQNLQDSRLKDCFFYFAAYPEYHDVSVKEIVSIWSAEGLVQDDVNSSFSGEEEGRLLLACLVAKSMIQVTNTGSCCRVHDVMRDLAQRNLKWDFASGEKIQASARDCLFAAGLRDSELPKEWTVSTMPCSAKRLSLRDNDLEHFPKPEQFTAPRLQVLILSGNAGLRSLSPSFFQNLSNLRVLHLSGTGMEKITGDLLRTLTALVMLDLTFCRYLVEVSDEIDSLQSLEILSLERCMTLLKLPLVSNLTSLKRFSAMVPSLKAGHGSRTHGDSTPAMIPYVLPANLRQLQLRGKKGSSANMYTFDISFLCALEELSLTGMALFPVGMMQLHLLRVLRISSCRDILHIREMGTKFPLLEELEIHSPSFDADPHWYEGAFPSLRRLQIYCVRLKNLFVFHPGTMPQIASLSMALPHNSYIPASIAELRSLSSLELTILEHESEITDENLESVFRQPDCFPHLQSLRIEERYYDNDGSSNGGESAKTEGESSSSATRGKTFSVEERERCVWEILSRHYMAERQKHGRLDIELVFKPVNTDFM